jgi:hypothetical protein
VVVDPPAGAALTSRYLNGTEERNAEWPARRKG